MFPCFKKWLPVAVAPLLVAALPAHAFPEKPVRVIVPFSAGGVTDAMVRLLQEPVAESLGQPVIIENRPGAAGSIAARAALDAPADGHTLLVVNTGLTAITPYVQGQNGVDIVNNFDAVAGLSSAPSVLLVNEHVPANSVKEFVDYARSHPGAVNYAVVGRGAYGDLTTQSFATQADLDMVAIPYPGNAQTTVALLANDVQMQLTILSGAMNTLIGEGRMKALGVATLGPSPLVPGVEPIANDLPGFEAVVLTGLVAPKGTPQAAIERLSDAWSQALHDPEIQQRLHDMGMAAEAMPAAAYATSIQREIDTFAPAIASMEPAN